MLHLLQCRLPYSRFWLQWNAVLHGSLAIVLIFPFFFTRHDHRTSQGAQGPTLGAM